MAFPRFPGSDFTVLEASPPLSKYRLYQTFLRFHQLQYNERLQHTYLQGNKHLLLCTKFDMHCVAQAPRQLLGEHCCRKERPILSGMAITHTFFFLTPVVHGHYQCVTMSHAVSAMPFIRCIGVSSSLLLGVPFPLLACTDTFTDIRSQR